MSYTIIAAVGKNRELGRNNDLIWHLKEDMKFFKEKTTNHKIIMGRKTLESLPKLLPNRHHIVLSSSNIDNPNIEVYKSLNELLDSTKDLNEEIFIIGGASIYKEFIDIADKMYLTEIDEECNDATVYFPYFDKEKWTKEIISTIKEDNISYKHILYKR